MQKNEEKVCAHYCSSISILYFFFNKRALLCRKKDIIQEKNPKITSEWPQNGLNSSNIKGQLQNTSKLLQALWQSTVRFTSMDSKYFIILK